MISGGKIKVYLVFRSINRTFGFAESTSAREKSQINLVFPSLNRTFDLRS